MLTKPFEATVYRRDEDGFRNLNNQNVLIYWPHGFGDWVFLSYILPLFEPSNRYFITRFGDDNTSIFDGSPFVTPLYLGEGSTHSGDGRSVGNQHFGLRLPENAGRDCLLQLPLALHD